MPPLEAWEKVFIEDGFLLSVHNTQNCIGCHGGVGDEDDMEAAHEGVVRDPLESSERVCGICHVDATRHASTSLHQNLTGYYTVLSARGVDFSDPVMEEAFGNHCDSCHTTCGQCHISRPSFTFGGLIAGHRVKSVASIRDTCMACHGARVANEYQGKNEGVEGSVHWLEEGMSCFQCHDVTEYHGDGSEPAHRYAGEPDVSCLDCHAGVISEESEIVEHEVHAETVACQVCHVSGPYKNCYDCHVGLDDQGLSYYQTEESQMLFKIGRNPMQSEDRPWEYVLVRHVPVAPDTFAFYGDDLIPQFDNVPTWKYATPHNIQRETPQNQTCECCHCNEDLFLTADDVAPDEMEANARVIVEEIPALPDCPQAADAAPPPAGPGWPLVLGIGIALAGVTATPIIIRRKDYRE
ncbi:MAG: hypothetical protein BAJATHORv1_140019 [Candidatus Thorarchaeota archaeon]|nr:MAG: hypothetical protein BAJATHORv1_140019 [Candidatus Thorarchaeota archaeon]